MKEGRINCLSVTLWRKKFDLETITTSQPDANRSRHFTLAHRRVISRCLVVKSSFLHPAEDDLGAIRNTGR